MSDKPEFRVYVDFDNDGSFGTSGDDISAYVMGGSLSRGIDDARDHVARTGQLELVLTNVDRRFSPAYAAGPYYGQLKPRLPVRVEAVHLGGTIALFEGHTTRWDPEQGIYGAKRCTLRCADLLEKLNTTSISIPLREAERTGTLVRHVLNHALGAPGAAATAAFAGNPANNDTITFNATPYIFKTTLSASPGEIKIGSTPEATIDNVVAAVGGGTGADSAYSTGTSRPRDVTAAARSSYYREVVADAPVRYYRLGETAGSSALDSGVNGLSGTYTGGVTLGGAGALSGDPDKAATFDGANDYVSMPSLDLANRSFTVEAWVYADASPPANQVWFSAHGAASTRASLHLRVTSAGALRVGFFNDDLVTGDGVFAFAQWHHLAVTYDYVADRVTLYLNGHAVASGSNGPFLGGSPALAIGCYIGYGSEWWKGKIDEFALYWTALSAPRIAAHYAARNVSVGLDVRCTLRGAFGDGIPIAESSAAITLSGAALSGGSDLPSGADIDAGTRAPDVAGDSWSKDVTALQALQQVADTEQGLIWIGRDGQFHFRDWTYTFTRASATPALTVTGELSHDGDLDEDDIANHVTVRMTPRSVSSSATSVVGKSDSVVQVPGKSGTARYDPNTPLENADGGSTSITLRFTDPETGKEASAKDLILPLAATTDWTANEARDGSGPDYTGNANLSFSVAVTATEAQVSVKNTALGPLYLTKLQVRGRLVTQYDPGEIVREDSGNQGVYGLRREQIDLPLPVDQAFAESLAAYTLRRYKDPLYRITRLSADNRHSMLGASLLDVEIGDVIALDEAQTGVEDARLLVTGVEYRWSAGGVLQSCVYHVRQIDDVQIGLFDDDIVGKFDVGQFGL